MKTVLFVPGYQEDLTTRDYGSVVKAIEGRGYAVKFVPIQWKRTTIVDWEAELNEAYGRYDPKDTILAGFSFGSMTALVAASHRNPAELWLSSLSPYFSDNLESKNMKQVWLNEFGKHRVTAFAELDFAKLSSEIHCPIKLFGGVRN
jgi:predicted alpha/beta hydrolase family esterase